MIEAVSLYIHVPFCVKRCPYCAFYSTEHATAAQIADYPRHILKEFALRMEDWRGFSLKSIYIGGGTPSLLKPAEVRAVLKHVKGGFSSAEEDIEITLECNPGTVDEAAIEGFLSAGVNRFSLGVQSVRNERLEFLGRIHDKKTALNTLKYLSKRIDAVTSIDLMVGTPLETRETWDEELKHILELSPAGLSFYSLTVEEGTALARRGKSERIHLTNDETVDLLLHISNRLAEAGYRHYEVSNWALPGFESRHNSHYWKRRKYIGLGPSAHSFDGASRYWTLPDLKTYYEALENGVLPPSEAEFLGAEEIRSEWVYLSLRVADGLSLAAYQELFGPVPHYWDVMFQKIAEAGMGNYDGVIFIPNDRGLLLADEIAARILG